MARLPISALAILVALSAGVAACGKDKKEPATETADSLACESHDDCEAGWVCLDGECANSASGAIYTDPSNAVTPDKVKSEIEKINEQSQKRADEILEGL